MTKYKVKFILKVLAVAAIIGVLGYINIWLAVGLIAILAALLVALASTFSN